MGYRGFASTKITSDESDTNRRLLRNGFIVVMLLNLNSKRWFFIFIVFHFGVVDVFVLVVERVSKLEAKRLFNVEQFFLSIQHKSRNWKETVGDGD